MTQVAGPHEAANLDFFLSYAGADRDWAEWVAWHLENAGYRVLIRAWDLVAGSDWVEQIDRGIRIARRTIALLSHAYLESVYGRPEWQVAWAADPTGFARRLLPVRVEDCPRPGLLSTVVSVDLFGRDADQARRKLLEEIRYAIDGRGKPVTAPGFPARSRRGAQVEPTEFPGRADLSPAPAEAFATSRSGGVTRPHGREVRSVTFSPDGRVLASGHLDGTARLWDVLAAHPVQLCDALESENGAISSVIFSSDSRTLIIGGDKAVSLWNVTEPAVPRQAISTAMMRPGSEIRSVAVSSDGQVLAVSGSDHAVRLWEVVERGAKVLSAGAAPIAHTAVVWSLAFAPHQRMLAIVSGPHLRLWDVSDPHRARLAGESGVVGGGADLCSVAFGRNGLAATGGFDRAVRLWDVADPDCPRLVGKAIPIHTAAAWSLAFTPDGRMLATADGRTVRLWDLADAGRPSEAGPPLAGHTGRICSLSFTPNGDLLATGSEDGTVRTWPVRASSI